MPAHDNAKPWTPEEDQLLEQLLLDPRMRNKNGQMPVSYTHLTLPTILLV